MQPYKELRAGEFTFQYQPWNRKGAKHPMHQFGVDTDVTSIGVFDDEVNFCKANPLNLTFGNWLWLIGNCKTIYTTSYHAFTFAIMFNRRIVCPNINARRFQSTIKLLNIKLSDEGMIENHAEVMENIKQRRKEIFDYIDNIYSNIEVIDTNTAKHPSRPIITKNDKQINPSYYNCRAKDKTSLDLSASGGISAIFAKAILDKGGIVYGAMFERDFKSVKVDWVDNIYDYYKHIAKSKYVYSFMPKFSSIKEKLDSGKLVFIGALPCQIVALHKYLNKDYPNLYTSALKCYGAAKPDFYKDFIEKIE